MHLEKDAPAGAGDALDGPARQATPSARRRRAVVALAAACVAAALLVGGCAPSGGGDAGSAAGQSGGNAEEGIASKSPADIVKAAQDALQAATSVRFKMDAVVDGEKMKADIKFDNKDTAGWMEVDGLRMDLILVDGTTYFRSPDLLREMADPQAADVIGNRWILMSEEMAGDMKEFTDEFTLAGFAKMFKELEPPGLVSKTVETVDGQSVVRLKGLDGYVDVMATGEPYPVRLEGSASADASNNGSMTFSDYGEDFGIKKPANPLDLAKIQG
jgi:hypothetical protein